ncbi:hypothetical protein BJX64DRAFT_63690 [Aspergillus heterothallicus]
MMIANVGRESCRGIDGGREEGPTEASNMEGSRQVTPHVTTSTSSCTHVADLQFSRLLELFGFPMPCKSPPICVASGRNSEKNQPRPRSVWRIYLRLKDTPVEASSTLAPPRHPLEFSLPQDHVLGVSAPAERLWDNTHGNRVYTSIQPQNTRWLEPVSAIMAHLNGGHPLYTARWHHFLLIENRRRRSLLHSSL